MAGKLLPKSHDDFRSQAYWDTFFKLRQKSGGTFEWYGEWKDIAPVVSGWLTPASRVLVIGCGNSNLSADLYDWGVRNIVNVDFSGLVIAEMKAKNAARGEMQWVECDVKALPFDAASFDAVLDKGMLDAMAAEDTEPVLRDVAAMFAESARVLKPSGKYVCVTLGQSFVLREMLAFPRGSAAPVPSSDAPWSVDLHMLSGMASTLCPAVLVATKPSSSVASSCAANILRLPDALGVLQIATVDTMNEAVREAQWLHSVRRKAAVVTPGNTFNIDLWSSDPAAAGATTPRFSITALDASRKQSCGVLLVPQGREHEWSFSNPEGMTHVIEGASLGRLYFVYLNRGHTFPSQEGIKVFL